MFGGSFKGSFKEVLRVFHESFREEEVSRMFHDIQGCSLSVSKVFQGSFKKTFKVFQKSFKLHGTHRSFPSRRRACFYENDFAHYPFTTTQISAISWRLCGWMSGGVMKSFSVEVVLGLGI